MFGPIARRSSFATSGRPFGRKLSGTSAAAASNSKPATNRARCGVPPAISRSSSGLRRGGINLVLTDHLPLYWDNDRALAGVTAAVGRLSRVPDCSPLCAWQSGPIPIGQYLCARAFARAAAGHLRQSPEVVPVRRARIPNRLVCKLPLAIPRWRRHSGVRPGLS